MILLKQRKRLDFAFSERRPVTLPTGLTYYVDPIIDTGASTSTRGTHNAARLFCVLCIPFTLDPPRQVDSHGWGTDCENSKLVPSAWYITVPVNDGRPTTIPFDLLEGESPLGTYLYLYRHGNIINRGQPSKILFRRPIYNTERSFLTCISTHDTGNPRLRMDISLHPIST